MLATGPYFADVVMFTTSHASRSCGERMICVTLAMADSFGAVRVWPSAWPGANLTFDGYAEISASHLPRKADIEQVEQSRRNIAERTIGTKAIVARFLTHVDHGHWIGGVRGMGTTCDRVDHHLRVAMIGGNQPASILFADRFINAVKLRV